MIVRSMWYGLAWYRNPEGERVNVIIRDLKSRDRHSPDGFNWGYGGSGPAELARSIIADVMGTSEPNPEVYQEFKRAFVASWGDQWEIATDEIRKWLTESRKEVS